METSLITAVGKYFPRVWGREVYCQTKYEISAPFGVFQMPAPQSMELVEDVGRPAAAYASGADAGGGGSLQNGGHDGSNKEKEAAGHAVNGDPEAARAELPWYY
jgi:hypothetical protein